MTAIANALLDSVKQYAQSLKKQLGISLSHAHELSARAHSFADWHELVTVSNRSPYDPRLRAAAISARSGPGLRVSAAIQVLRDAAVKLAFAAGLDPQEAAAIDAKARSFETDLVGGDPRLPGALTTVEHMAMNTLSLPSVSGTVSPWNFSVGSDFRLNLFDPQAHLVLVSACSGWGKSAFAAGLAGAHYATGGAVFYVDPLFSPQAHDKDRPGRLLASLMGNPDVVVVDAANLTERKSLSRFTLVKTEGQSSPDELLAVLNRAKAWLKPFSVVVIDEAHFPRFGSTDQFRLAMATIIDELLDSGIAVVLISQDCLVDDLPMRWETQECMLLLFGLGQYTRTAPTIPSNRRKRTKRGLSIEDVLRLPPPPGPPSGAEQFQALAKEILHRSRDDYTSWIGVATTPDEDVRTFVAKQRWAAIEETFPVVATSP